MTKIPHHIALKIATRLYYMMQPHCLRVEIAGSVRREKAEVGDIEIVAIPTTYVDHVQQRQGSFFGQDIQAVKRSCLVDEFITKLPNTTWMKPGFKGTNQAILTHGKSVFKEVPELRLDMYKEFSSAGKFGVNRKHWKGLTWYKDIPVKLDIFLANNDNFGVIHFIRTGSREFNIRMLAALKKQGYAIHEGYLKRIKPNSDPMAFVNIEFCPEESYIFQKAGMAFVKPENRE